MSSYLFASSPCSVSRLSLLLGSSLPFFGIKSSAPRFTRSRHTSKSWAHLCTRSSSKLFSALSSPPPAHDDVIMLGIETSCDDTAAAVVLNPFLRPAQRSPGPRPAELTCPAHCSGPRLPIRGPPATGRFRQKSTVDDRLKGEIDRRWSIEGEINRRRLIEREKGKKKKKRKRRKKEKRRRRIPSTRARSSLACRRCLRAALARAPSSPGLPALARRRRPR
ncbi:hypothetical protein GW17_00060224, partial [Ensete ventricosum]